MGDAKAFGGPLTPEMTQCGRWRQVGNAGLLRAKGRGGPGCTTMTPSSPKATPLCRTTQSREAHWLERGSQVKEVGAITHPHTTYLANSLSSLHHPPSLPPRCQNTVDSSSSLTTVRLPGAWHPVLVRVWHLAAAALQLTTEATVTSHEPGCRHLPAAVPFPRGAAPPPAPPACQRRRRGRRQAGGRGGPAANDPHR